MSAILAKTRPVHWFWALALLAMLHASPGLGQQAAKPEIDGRPLKDFLNSEAYIQALRRYVALYETRVGPCRDARPTARVRTVLVRKRFFIPGLDIKTTPQWVEAIRIEGCKTSYERLVFSTRGRGKTIFIALARGGTKADPLLQYDLLKALLPLARARAVKAGCGKSDRVGLITTRALAAAADAPKGTWSEIWQMGTCKGERRYRIDFRPAKSGGTVYDIRSED